MYIYQGYCLLTVAVTVDEEAAPVVIICSIIDCNFRKDSREDFSARASYIITKFSRKT